MAMATRHCPAFRQHYFCRAWSPYALSHQYNAALFCSPGRTLAQSLSTQIKAATGAGSGGERAGLVRSHAFAEVKRYTASRVGCGERGRGFRYFVAQSSPAVAGSGVHGDLSRPASPLRDRRAKSGRARRAGFSQRIDKTLAVLSILAVRAAAGEDVV